MKTQSEQQGSARESITEWTLVARPQMNRKAGKTCSEASDLGSASSHTGQPILVVKDCRAIVMETCIRRKETSRH